MSPHHRRRGRISRWVVSERVADALDLNRPSDQAVERAVRLLTLLAVSVANAIGSIVVFAIAAWLLPSGSEGEQGAGIVANLILAGIYVAIIIPLTSWAAIRRTRPGRIWLHEERPPTAAEQRNLLRSPLQVALLVALGWFAAAILFGAFNTIDTSFELGRRVAITIALAGLVTGAFTYMFSERLLRPAAARALAARPLDKPALPGLTARALTAWVIGSAIPLLGIVMISLAGLTESPAEGFDRTRLAIAALSLAGGAIVIGFFAVLFAARSSAVPIVSVRTAIGEIEQGELEAEVPVYDGTEIGLLQAGFNRMAEGLRERERIRQLFGMHVGEEVARGAMDREGALGGERRQVAILFVDLIGSTTIASERPPEEVVELLNDFFGLVVETVEEEGGWVNKFEGDAALAVFGVPEELEDCAGRALAAGRRLAERLEQEVEGAEAGIGVSYGDVVAGNIGSEHRYEYTVIGDAVNEAARLTELAKSKPGRLLASGDAVEAASAAEASRWTIDDEVELRGRTRPTRLAIPSAAPGAETDD